MNSCVEMKEIYKTFQVNRTVALKGASLYVEKGTIHALLGENGAGKTTLMRILCGLEKMDSGKIFLNGMEVHIKNHHDALRHGIAMVHQNLSLIESFTGLENIVLQKMPSKFFVFLDLKQAKKTINRIMEQSGIFVDLDKKISDLSVAERQKVEILRVLYLSADILIFDEPTSYLTELESEQFFKVMENLKKSGKTIIFITHSVQDALMMSDQITVLRNGVTVYSSKEKPSPRELSQIMAGETQIVRKETICEGKKVLLRAENLTFKIEKKVFGPISFQIKENEILGIAGFNSSGAVELIETIAGTRKVSDGRLTFLGKEITHDSIGERRKAGIGYIPHIQKALSMDLPVVYNLIVSNYREFSHLGWLDYRKIEEWTDRLVREYEIKISSVWQPARTLSGGNLQRVVVAREIKLNPKLLIACDPTRGLDLKSANSVHRIFLKLCEQNSSILIYSSDLDEMLKICDRILVISKGRLVEEFENNPSLTKSRLIEAMLSYENRTELV